MAIAPNGLRTPRPPCDQPSTPLAWLEHNPSAPSSPLSPPDHHRGWVVTTAQTGATLAVSPLLLPPAVTHAVDLHILANSSTVLVQSEALLHFCWSWDNPNIHAMEI